MLPPSLELRGIRKSFDGFTVLDGADFAASRGEVHALLGENGAGKSSLMNIAAGLYTPEAGTLRLDGVIRRLSGPREAAALGIGMVHQHYKLAHRLTVAENVLLAMRERGAYRTRLRQIEQAIADRAASLGLPIDPCRLVDSLSVAEQQRVEILKALIGGATTLILDEPTAVLTDTEADRLLTTMRRFAASGSTVILVTHKLGEVMRFADRVTVMRAGRVVASREPRGMTVAELTELVVGAASPRGRPEVGAIDGPQAASQCGLESGSQCGAQGNPQISLQHGPQNSLQHGPRDGPQGGLRHGPDSSPRASSQRAPGSGPQGNLKGGPESSTLDAPKAPCAGHQHSPPMGVRLTLRKLRCERGDGHVAVPGLDLELRAGEIVGLAGVGGNGQTELMEALMGVRPPRSGEILLEGAGDIATLPPDRRQGLAIAVIPADRSAYALAGSLSVAENYALGGVRAGRYGGTLRLRRRRMREDAAVAVREFEVQGVRSLAQKAALLSGGNAQKLVLAREFARRPNLVLAHSPSRGLDVRATADVHRRLVDARAAGAAVLLISDDLDEVLALADRVGVLNRGRLVALLDAPVDRQVIGQAMVGHA